jgi:hypothetical protein
MLGDVVWAWEWEPVAVVRRTPERITVAALVAILERAAIGRRGLSNDENMLFIACEFWAGAAVRNLPRLLRRAPADSLQTASKAFATIGAMETALTLQRAADRAKAASTTRQARQFLRELGQRLRASAEPVDLLIARFASTLVPGLAGGELALH